MRISEYKASQASKRTSHMGRGKGRLKVKGKEGEGDSISVERQ